MKPEEIDMIPLEVPSLLLPERSYGFSNEKLIGKQINTQTNREILRSQYFWLTLQCTSWNSTSTEYRVRPDMIGLNGQVNVSMTNQFLDTYGTSYTHLSTLNYSTEFNNDYIMLIPPWGIIEVNWQINRATESLRVWYTWTLAFLYGWSLSITSTTSTSFCLINKGTTHSRINLYYSDTSVWNPFFSVFIKLYF